MTDEPSPAEAKRVQLPWPLHEACRLWPDMPEDAFPGFIEDIRKHGLRDAIMLTPSGELLDGKNRARACILAGVELRTEVYHDDPWKFAISKNEHRRNMTEEEHRKRARLAARASEMAANPVGANQLGEGGEAAPPSIAEAAKTNRVTVDDVKSYRVVEKHGTPEEKAAVMSGKAALRGTADRGRARLASTKTPKQTLKSDDQVIADLAAAIVKRFGGGEPLTSRQIADRLPAPVSNVEKALALLGPQAQQLADNRYAIASIPPSREAEEPQAEADTSESASLAEPQTARAKIEARLDAEVAVRFQEQIATKDAEIAEWQASAALLLAEIEALEDEIQRRSPGRPKGDQPWLALGISRVAYYGRQARERK
jgi:hypothetical protein